MRLFVRKEMLNTLKSIDSTLKRIEQNLGVSKSQNGRTEATSHGYGEYMRKAIAGAIHDISQ